MKAYAEQLENKRARYIRIEQGEKVKNQPGY